jgi:hypothetical protein
MKRFFMLVAVVILSTSWASPAQAQLGFGGFGGDTDTVSEIEAARSQIKLKNKNYSKAKPRAGKGLAARPSVSTYNVNSLDRFGRMDLAGRSVSGYPPVRGGINAGLHVSRGGANGTGASRSARRRK